MNYQVLCAIPAFCFFGIGIALASDVDYLDYAIFDAKKHHAQPLLDEQEALDKISLYLLLNPDAVAALSQQGAQITAGQIKKILASLDGNSLMAVRRGAHPSILAFQIQAPTAISAKDRAAKNVAEEKSQVEPPPPGVKMSKPVK